MRTGGNMPKIFRRIVACFVLSLMTLLFCGADDTVRAYLAWLPEWQVVPAVLGLNLLVLIVLGMLTILLGRVYCSVICPLGIFQDVISWLSGRLGKVGRRFSYQREKKQMRWIALILFLSFFVAGLPSWAMLAEPYSAFGRMAANLFDPLVRLIGAGNCAVGFGLGAFLVAVITFCVVAVCAWSGGRVYCNSVCPVGTVLGVLSRFALFRPVIDRSKCIRCGRCASQCKASCLDYKNGCVEMNRCVVCLNCLASCREGAIALRPFWKAIRSEEISRGRTQSPQVSDPSRRHFLRMSVRAFVAVPVLTNRGGGSVFGNGVRGKASRHAAVLPAGAGNWSDFVARCTGCHLCVVNCPQGVLRPSDDWQMFMQPSLTYECGFCPPECNVCSQVCPTEAIHPVTVEEKSSVRVGRAVWTADRCLVLSEGRACGNCARHCPSGAIYMKLSDPNNPHSLRIPAVDDALCIGCGACEYYCLASPLRAMRVEGFEKHRVAGEEDGAEQSLRS